MELATSVIAPVQQAVPAVSGSPGTMPVLPPAAPAAPVPAPVSAAPGALGAAFPQPQPLPVVGTPGTPAAPAPAVAPVVTPAQPNPEFLALQQEHKRVLAEIQRLTPWAAIGYRAQSGGQPGQAPAVPPTPATPAPARAGVPALDPMVQAFLIEREGQIVEAPGAPPGTLAAYQKHQRDTAAYLRLVAEDPLKALGPIVDQVRKDAIEEAKKQFAGETKQQQDQYHAKRIMSENAPWMYERDQTGNVLGDFDPLTGNQSPRLTEGGRVWQQSVQALVNQGMTDPVAIDTYAKSQVHLWAWQKQEALKAQQAQQQPTPPPATFNVFGVPTVVPVTAPVANPGMQLQMPADPRMQFLAKIPGAMPGSYAPPPGGTPPPVAPQVPRRSVNPLQEWRQEALQSLIAAGYNENSRLPVGGG